MNRRFPTAAATLLAALMLAPAPARAAAGVAAAHGFVPHRLIVKLARSERPRTVVLPPQTSVREVAAVLQANPAVEYAAPDYIATASVAVEEPPSSPPNDPGPISGPPGPPGGWVTKQWNFLPWEGTGTPLLPVSAGGIDAVGAWEHLKAAGHPGAAGVTVAVLDTGIAYRAQGKRFRRSPDFTSVACSRTERAAISLTVSSARAAAAASRPRFCGATTCSTRPTSRSAEVLKARR